MRRDERYPCTTIGQRFGRLVVLAHAGRAKYWERIVRCKCDCGNEKDIYENALKRGLTQSCGCLRRELQAARFPSPKRHHPLYSTWVGIIARCTNPNMPCYPLYGGRGISMCIAWRTGLEAFAADVGPRPSPAHTIDRIDNNGNYEPGNVRWATRREQAVNRRSTRMLTIGGRTMCAKDWERATGVSRRTLLQRIDRGVPETLLFSRRRVA